MREQQRRGEVKGVEAAQRAIECERGGFFHEALVDLDDAEHGPLFSNRLGDRLAGG